MVKKTLSLGERLLALRLERGFTQKDLAEPAYTHAYVSTIEAGRRHPSPAALEHFAGKLGVTVEELTTGRSPGLRTQLEVDLQEARRLLSKGNHDEGEQLIKRVRRDAKSFEFRSVEARAIEALGSLAELRGHLDDAIEQYDRALALLQDEAPTSWAYATAGKARSVRDKGEAHFAIHLLENLRARLEKEGLVDPTAEAWMLGPLVLAYFDVGMRTRAGDLAERALGLIPTIPDETAAASLLVNVARVHQQRGEYDQALQALRKAEDIYKALDFRTELAVAHLAKGYVRSRAGDLSDARQELSSAMEILEETASVTNLANAAAELGRVERLTGERERAEGLLKRSIDLLTDSDDPRVLAWSKRELALVYSEERPRKAETLFKDAIDLYRTTSDVVELAHTYRHYGDFLITQGRKDAGHEAHRRGLLGLERGL